MLFRSDVLFGNHDFTDTPPVETKAYLDAARELDRVYQSALRWRMMSGYLGYLAERRHQDVRGWYFLSRLESRAEKLRGFSQLGHDEQEKLRGWLAEPGAGMARTTPPPATSFAPSTSRPMACSMAASGTTRTL